MTTEAKKLAENNMNLARFVARQFKNTGLSYEDLEGIAFLGLTKAAARFDETRACFSTYAVPAIRNEILMTLRKRTVNEVSLDTPVAEGLTLADSLGAESKELTAVEDRAFLNQSMRLLKKKRARSIG